MNDVDRSNDSLQYDTNHILQPVIQEKKKLKKNEKRMINKSKARIIMLDDTEEYVDLNVCRK